jgi:hypothetical protein
MRSLWAKALAVVAALVLAVLVIWVSMNGRFGQGEGDVSVDTRSTCSHIPPYTTGGVRVVPTLPPWCWGGPRP